MAEVIWRLEALEQLDAIANYIEQFHPAAADRVRHRLRELGESLYTSPKRGRLTPTGTRQIVIVKPYTLTYRIERDVVYIVDVRHSAGRPQTP